MKSWEGNSLKEITLNTPEWPVFDARKFSPAREVAHCKSLACFGYVVCTLEEPPGNVSSFRDVAVPPPAPARAHRRGGQHPRSQSD